MYFGLCKEVLISKILKCTQFLKLILPHLYPMMGGLAVAWQVNVTLSPSRTERGSMDRVTVGGSAQ